MGNIQTNQAIEHQKDTTLTKYLKISNKTSCNSSSSSLSEMNYIQIQKKQKRLPSVTVRETPFKKYLNLEELAEQSRLITIPQKYMSWDEVIYHPHLFQKILDYLPISEDHNIMLTSKRLSNQLHLHRVSRQNHWQMILWKIQSIPKSYDYDILSHNQQQSQHSMDLDRTQSFFNIEQDIQCQVEKLDHVMKALNVSMPYFQGLNSIVAVLLSFFNEKQTYQISKLIINKCNNIQNDCLKYDTFMNQLENELSIKTPKICSILKQQDLQIQYFAMKWVLGVFSYDLGHEQLSRIWGMICVFGLVALKSFIIAIFIVFEGWAISSDNQILIPKQFEIQSIQDQATGDIINIILKDKLRHFFIIKGQQIFNQTKKLLIKHKQKSHSFEPNHQSNLQLLDPKNSNQISQLNKCPSSLWYIPNQTRTQIYEEMPCFKQQKLHQQRIYFRNKTASL